MQEQRRWNRPVSGESLGMSPDAEHFDAIIHSKALVAKKGTCKVLNPEGSSKLG
jgi:hypothetical protein